MNNGVRAVGLFAVLAWRAVGGEPNFEFTGVLVSSEKTWISVTDREGGTAKWVESGHTFNGYVVQDYDPKKETIALAKDGVITQLPLKNAKVQTATAPEIEPMTRDARLALWTQIKDLEGDPLVAALVANGNQKLKAIAERFQQTKVTVAGTIERLTAALANPTLNDEKKAVLNQALSELPKREGDLHDAVVQLALTVKRDLRDSLEK